MSQHHRKLRCRHQGDTEEGRPIFYTHPFPAPYNQQIHLYYRLQLPNRPYASGPTLPFQSFQTVRGQSATSQVWATHVLPHPLRKGPLSLNQPATPAPSCIASDLPQQGGWVSITFSSTVSSDLPSHNGVY